jgi:predicted nucleic-acid-binding Zn-ribbon protein
MNIAYKAAQMEDKTAQKIWCKKFGYPEYYLKDYWGQGSHYMVWRIQVKEDIDLFNPI